MTQAQGLDQDVPEPLRGERETINPACFRAARVIPRDAGQAGNASKSPCNRRQTAPLSLLANRI